MSIGNLLKKIGINIGAFLLGAIPGMIISATLGLKFWLPDKIESLKFGAEMFVGGMVYIIATAIGFGFIGIIVGGIFGIIVVNLLGRFVKTEKVQESLKSTAGKLKKEHIAIVAIILVVISIILGLGFQEQIKGYIHFYRYKKEFNEFAQQDRSTLKTENAPYYYDVNLEYSDSISFRIAKSGSGGDSEGFYTWHLVYIETDDPDNRAECSFDGDSMRIEDKWYLCKVEWN